MSGKSNAPNLPGGHYDPFDDNWETLLDSGQLDAKLDRLVMHSGQADVINLPAVEAICRRIYGLMRAFEDVHRESDWQKPKSNS